MISVNEDDLTNLAPELGDVDPELIDTFIAWANDEIDVDKVGTSPANRLALYLVAHLCTLYKRAQSGGGTGAALTGPLQSVTIGPVSKTFATAATGVTSTTSEKALASTSYGTEFQRLVRLFAPRMAVL